MEGSSARSSRVGRFGPRSLTFRVLLVVLVPMIALQLLTFRDARDERREAESAQLVKDRLDTFHVAADLVVPLSIEFTVSAGFAAGRERGASDELIDRFGQPGGIDSFIALRASQMTQVDATLDRLDGLGVDVATMRATLDDLRRGFEGTGRPPMTMDEVEAAAMSLRDGMISIYDSAGARARDGATTNELLNVTNESERMVAGLQYGSDELWHAMMAAVSTDPFDHMVQVLDSEGALTASLDRFEQTLRGARAAELDALRGSESFDQVSEGRSRFLSIVTRSATPVSVAASVDDMDFVMGFLGASVQRLTEIQDFSHSLFGSESAAVADIRADARDARWMALAIMVATAVVSLVLLVLLIRSILRPLSRLMRQSRLVRQGDLHLDPVKPTGPTDLRVVTRAFNDMVNTLQAYESQLDQLARGETTVDPTLPGPLGETVRRSVSQLADVTARLHASEADANHRARLDSLTGLANRRAALERLAVTALEARDRGTPAAIIFLDLDGFKSVNDTQGHAEGDRILVEIADRLRMHCPDDIVARIGGDEFLVVLSEVASIDEATARADGLIGALSEPITGSSGQVFTLSASAGVSLVEGDREPLACIAQADTAVYHAKERGRGRVEAYDERLAQVIEERAELALTMRQGLAERQFSLRLQPIIDVATKHPVGAEVLLRWNRPGIGEVSPAEFIPVAERTGVIVDLETWVFEQAVAILRDWRIDPVTAGMRLAVNVSGRHIVEGNLAPLLDELCRRAQVDPTLLDLEITETHLMSDVYRSIVVVDDLRRQGVNVAIDDFGTGYSSMSYLHQLTVDALKIDQVFVAGMVDDRLDRTIVELLLRLGDSLGLKVIAEGVDSEQKLQLLGQLGCPWAQGFHIAMPMHVEEATRWLKQQHALATSMA